MSRSKPGDVAETGESVPAAQASNVPTRWSRHLRRLLALRDKLLREREEEIADASTPVEPHAVSPADSATDEFDHELAVGLLSHEQDALYEVDAAIRRILDGSYGICEDTGRMIPLERLDAVPWTRFSKQAQEKRERDGISQPLRLGDLASVRSRRLRAPTPPAIALEDLTPEEAQDGDDLTDGDLLPFRAEQVTKALENAAVSAASEEVTGRRADRMSDNE